MLTTKAQRHKDAATGNPESRIQKPECGTTASLRLRVVASPRLALPFLLLALLVGVVQADSLYVRLLGSHPTNGPTVCGLGMRGDYACVADPAYFAVISIADPRHPIEVGRCSTANAQDIDVEGDYAYVANRGDSSLGVISVADPAHPVEVARCSIPAAPISVIVRNGYAYLSDVSGAFRVISVADPTHPVEVGHCQVPAARRPKLIGDYVYLPGGDRGLHIVSIADPTHPVEVGSYLPGGASAVAVGDGYAYIVCRDSSFRVISIADPTNPVEISRIDSLYSSPDAVMVRNYVFVLSGHGLRVVSVADSIQPREVAYYDFGGGWSIALGSRYLFVGGGVSFSILQFYQPGDLDIDPDSLDIVGDTLKLVDSGRATPGRFAFGNTSASFNPDTTDGPSLSRLDSITCVGYLIGPGDTLDSIIIPNLPRSLTQGQTAVCSLSVYLPPDERNGDYIGSITIAGKDTAHLIVEDSFYVSLTVHRKLGDLDLGKDSLDVVADTIRLRPRLEAPGPPPIYTSYALGEFVLSNTSSRHNPDTLDGPSRSPLESLHCTGSLVGPGGTIDSVFILNAPALLAQGRAVVCTLAAYLPPGYAAGEYRGAIVVAGTDTAGYQVADTFYATAAKLGDLDVDDDSLSLVRDTIDVHTQPAGPVYSPYAKAEFMLVNTSSEYNPDAGDGPSRSTLRDLKVEARIGTAKDAKSAKARTQAAATDSVYVLNLPESLAVGQAVECTLALVLPVGTPLSGYSGVVTVSALDTLGYEVADSFYLVVRGPEPRQSLDSLRVAPIPFKPNQNPEHDAIHFQGLSAGARVTVYDASGQTVWTATENGDGHLKWNANVASGIYAYLVVSADGKSSKVGKLSVIR
jgi:hypothetical protein